jgi:hypothetical protein
MARTYLASISLASLLLLGPAYGLSQARAATASAGRPSIAITNLHNGSVVTGSSITVDVSVSNFKLVPPIYVNPPRLTGARGHIHYVLDSLANFVARRDATVSLSHTWSNVAPGKHTVMAYLATSQHARFPGVPQAQVSITVDASPHPSTNKPTSRPATMPQTGGAATESAVSGRSGLVAPCLALIALGVLLLGAHRRSERAGRA